MVLGFIILGLLSSKPMTGYDLKIFFNNSINFFWTAELSQIYRELSKLEKEGFISYVIEHQDGKPDKKIYSITEKGQKKFIDWLKKFPEKLNTVSRNEFLVRIFFSSHMSNEELISQLEKYIKEQEEEIKIYRSIEERMNSILKEEICSDRIFHQRLTVRRGLYFAQSEIDWANECIREIKNYK